MNDNEKLYKKCLDRWGTYSQVDMCIEEMAELTKALCKSKRAKRSKDWHASICEEIADVKIMLEQMILIFDAKELVEWNYQEKLRRLEEEVKK